MINDNFVDKAFKINVILALCFLNFILFAFVVSLILCVFGFGCS